MINDILKIGYLKNVFSKILFIVILSITMTVLMSSNNIECYAGENKFKYVARVFRPAKILCFNFWFPGWSGDQPLPKPQEICMNNYIDSRQIPEKVTIRLFYAKVVKSLTISSENLSISSSDLKKTGSYFVVKMIPGENRLSVKGKRQRFSSISPLKIESRYPINISYSGGDPRLYRSPVFIRNTAKQLVVTTTVPFEEYIAGVVRGELPRGRGEALRAQAVAARSYAIKNRERHAGEGYDYCDATHCQFYRGFVPKSSPYYHTAMDTRGLVLAKNGRLIESLYHSTCGGRTSDPVDVFGRDIFGVIGVKDRLKGDKKYLCADSPHFYWKYKIKKNNLLNILRKEPEFNSIKSIKKVSIVKKDKAGRVVSLKIAGEGRIYKISGYDFWQMMGSHIGWGKIKSTLLSVNHKGELIEFGGRGLGHGLGMCQWGAMKLAKRGYDFRKILLHYFPEAEVVPYR
ncbi:MAG: SpoIID/LytB domain-containing protein [Candidatus Eremiobacteraeota bacterium]|nr:SpoIID/LytB domain-containing protein [Candidatus Eremiobacteraeota bacterium]